MTEPPDASENSADVRLDPTAADLAERRLRANRATRGGLAAILCLEAFVVLLVPRTIAQTSTGLSTTSSVGLIAFAILLLSASAAAPREALGVHGGWGAFRDARPPRCFAIAEPAQRRAGEHGLRAFASVGWWPRTRVRAQLHVRLRRLKLVNAPVTLAIGDARFGLVGGGADAWAPDWRADAAIVAAMRGGTSMSIETRDRDGRGFADVYALRGAATALDAAALACR